ncbi:MAG: MmcQ/YjbR family DNA-binding protein [Acidobacteriaceae bacterium]|nr:MmcQ/YjbR family DNA-binding protein [Acidobacteriaceae bacterium]
MKAGPAPKLDKGKQLARLRRICKSIPGTIEKLSHGEPTFFTPKRVFAMFANNHHGDGRVAVWLPAAAGVQTALIEEAPETYFRPPYVGVNGWVGVELSKVDDEQLGALVREAFRFIDQKTRTSRSSKSPKPVRAEMREPQRARKT